MADTTVVHLSRDRLDNIKETLEDAGIPVGTKQAIGEKALDALEEKLSQDHGVDF